VTNRAGCDTNSPRPTGGVFRFCHGEITDTSWIAAMSSLPSYAHRAIAYAQQRLRAGCPPHQWPGTITAGEYITGLDAAQVRHPLRASAARNDGDTIRALLVAGLDPNHCDGWGCTDALMWAVSMPQAGHAGIIAVLMADDLAHVPPGPEDDQGADVFHLARERAREIARWYTASPSGDRLTAAVGTIDAHIHARRARWERQQLAAVAESADRTPTKRRM
jgi:hypothetical protein